MGWKKANKLPATEFSDCQMTEALALPRWLPLLHYDSIDLPVVWNDRYKRASLLWSASPALQRVQDIFQPIIDVVHGESRTLNK